MSSAWLSGAGCFFRLRDATAGKRLSPEELTSILQQVYVKEPDGLKTLLVTYRNRLAKASRGVPDIYTMKVLIPRLRSQYEIRLLMCLLPMRNFSASAPQVPRAQKPSLTPISFTPSVHYCSASLYPPGNQRRLLSSAFTLSSLCPARFSALSSPDWMASLSEIW